MNTVKKIMWLIAMFYMAEGNVFAGDSDISVTLSSKVYSKYLSEFGTASVCHDKPVLQTDLFVSLPKGFYLDIWHSAGLDGTSLSSDYGDEIDYTLGWSGKVKEINFDLGISYFDLVDLLKAPQGDLIYPYFGINKRFNLAKGHLLDPFISFGFPYSAKGDEFGHGFYTRIGVRHFWQISEELKLYHKANLFFDDGATGLDSGVLGQYRCDFSYQISKSITLDLISIKLNTPITSLSDQRDKTNVSYGTGITYRF